jgi:hypothetical protein
MAAPLTPKPTRKAEALARAPPTIVSRPKEDVALKENGVWYSILFLTTSTSSLFHRRTEDFTTDVYFSVRKCVLSLKMKKSSSRKVALSEPFVERGLEVKYCRSGCPAKA